MSPGPVATEPMRVLLAEDEPVTRRLLQASLQKLGYDVVVAHDGLQAWAALTAPEAPSLALLDWNMPGLDGPDVCAKVRARGGRYTWILLLTTRGTTADVVTGLRAGADDFVAKPVNVEELSARLIVGQRLVWLERQLATRVEQLEVASRNA